MTSAPIVSIVVPAYNAEETLAKTIESLVNQTYRDVEILVIDDGSTDRTAAIAKGFGSKVVYHYQQNSGTCAAPRNAGIRLSVGEMVGFLDSDDLLVPDAIERQVEFLMRHPEVGLVLCDYQNFSEDGSGSYSHTHFESCALLRRAMNGSAELVIEDARSLLAEEYFGSAGTFLIRRRLLNAIVGFEESLQASEDFHFLFIAARHSPLGVIDYVGMRRRIHKSNMTRDTERMMREGWRAILMLIATEPDRKVRDILVSRDNLGWFSWGRKRANEGRLWSALMFFARGLRGQRDIQSVQRFVRESVRAIAIGLRLYRSNDR